MKRISVAGQFRVSILTFILSAIIYLLFLFLLRYDLRPNLLLFWIPSILMATVIAYQILRHGKNPGSGNLILLEIFLLTFLFHLQAVIPSRGGIVGDDFISYFYTTKAILYGFPASQDFFATSPFREMHGLISALAMYPVMHMIVGASSLISGIELTSASLWMPSIWSSTAILAIYLFTKSIYGDRRTALLAALAFSAYIIYIEVHSQYTRESIAFTMIFFTLYAFHAAYYKNYKNSGTLRALVLFFAITVTLSHYLGAVMLVAILIVWASSSIGIVNLARKVKYLPSISASQDWGFGLIAFAIVIAFSHWMYIEVSVLPSLANVVLRNVVRYGSPTFHYPGAYSALKTVIISSGIWFFTAIFAIILLLEVVKGIRGKCNYLKEDLTIGVWTVVGFVIYSILAARPHILMRGRLPIFFYPFALIAVSHAALTANNAKIKQIIVGIIILFLAFNLFQLSFVSLNPLSAAEQTQITSRAVYSRYPQPNDLQGMAAARFYQGTEDANFTQWFVIGDKKVMAQAYETFTMPWYKYRPRPYTKTYIIVSYDSYPYHDRIYNNGIVAIYKE